MSIVLCVIFANTGCALVPVKPNGGFRITSQTGKVYYSRSIDFSGIKGVRNTNTEELAIAYLNNHRSVIRSYLKAKVVADITTFRTPGSSKLTIVKVPKTNTKEATWFVFSPEYKSSCVFGYPVVVRRPQDAYIAYIFRNGLVGDFNKLGKTYLENGGAWGIGVISFVSQVENRKIGLRSGDMFRIEGLSENEYLKSLHPTATQ